MRVSRWRSALRALLRPQGYDYEVTNEGGLVVLDTRPGGPRFVLSPLEARKLSVSLAMAAGRADGRDEPATTKEGV